MWPFTPRIEALRRRGDVRGLIKASCHGKASVRLRAVEALAESGSREAMEALVYRLGDADRAVRQAAAEALLGRGPTERVAVITAVLERVGCSGDPREDLRAWRSSGEVLGGEVLALTARAGGDLEAQQFLSRAAVGEVPLVERGRAADLFAELASLEGVRALLAEVEALAEETPPEPSSADLHRIRLLGRVAGARAVAARAGKHPDWRAELEGEIQPRAVVALERLLLQSNTAEAAVEALGLIASPQAIGVLGRALTGEALSALPEEVAIRERIVEALVDAREGASEGLRRAINSHLAAALRLTGAARRDVRSAAGRALADWTPDNAEDHAWLLMAGGMYAEAAELGAPAIEALSAAVGGDSFLDDQERAIDALISLKTEEALLAMRRLLEQPDLHRSLREKLERALEVAEAEGRIAALRSHDPQIRRAAADWLEERDLVPPPGSEDEAFYLAARGDFDALLARGPVAEKALCLAAESEPLQAGIALARLGSDRACDYLGPLVRRGGPGQAEAIEALTELASERAALILATALGKVPDPEPIRRALIGMGETAIPALRPALTADDPVLNRLAAEIVGAVGYAPEGSGEAAALAVAAGEFERAAAIGLPAVGHLRRFITSAARRHAPYGLLSEVAEALVRVLEPGEVLRMIDEAHQPTPVRLTLAGALARAGEARGVDRLLRWVYATPRRADQHPIPWLLELFDALADRMGLTGKAARAMVLVGTFVPVPLEIGGSAVGMRADTAPGTEALHLLLESDLPAAVNALNLVADLEDAEVRVGQSGYDEPVVLRVDYGPRRRLARRRLRQLGKPPYDPEAYFNPLSE